MPATGPVGKTSTSKKPQPVSPEELGFSQRGAPGTNMVMHRLGAGDLDESGWCHATSTGGGFSVSLPNVFNDFSMTAKAEDGVEVKTFVLATRDERLVKFTVLAMSRPDGKFKGDPLQGLVEKFEEQGDLKEKRAISLGKMSGIELKVANRSASAVFRLYKDTKTLYQLIVEAPSSIKPNEIEDDVKRFMDSFTVADKAQD
jgi:hypothetical protein